MQASYSNARAVTPSNTTDLPHACRALYVGGTGAVSVRMAGEPAGSSVVFAAVPTGTILHGVQVRRVLATGTTATALVALW